MTQNIIPYTWKNWSALQWSLSIKHAITRAWNDEMIYWMEAELPTGKFAFGFDHNNNTLYTERMEG